jgi:hypothetical protein
MAGVLNNVALPPKTLEELASDCTARTEKVFPIETKLAENAERLYIELMDITIRVPKMTDRQIVTLGLSIKIFRLLQSIRADFMNGYYEVAEGLLRLVLEHSQLTTMFAKYEDKALKYLQGTKYDPGYVREKIAGSSTELESLRQAHKAFSEHASHIHSIQSFVKVVASVKGKQVEFVIYPTFNKEEAQFCFSYFLHWYWFSIEKLHEAFLDRIKDNKAWMDKFAKWDNVFITYIKEDVKRQRTYLKSSS